MRLNPKRKGLYHSSSGLHHYMTKTISKLNSIRKRILGLNCSDFCLEKGMNLRTLIRRIKSRRFSFQVVSKIFSEANGIWNHFLPVTWGCLFCCNNFGVCFFLPPMPKNAPCQSGFTFFPPIIKGNSFQQKNPSSIAISFTFRLFCWKSPQKLAGSQ